MCTIKIIVHDHSQTEEAILKKEILAVSSRIKEFNNNKNGHNYRLISTVLNINNNTIEGAAGKMGLSISKNKNENHNS